MHALLRSAPGASCELSYSWCPAVLSVDTDVLRGSGWRVGGRDYVTTLLAIGSSTVQKHVAKSSSALFPKLNYGRSFTHTSASVFRAGRGGQERYPTTAWFVSI
ncbi:hypothetical protein BaRGS_00013737 [Batillaria attramentaria]|uniref:Uncharacterized protein n=1 Tax=Batillaria attramentaria TaxID=370345 RepID=A0ABD0L6V1_9CAEN